MHKKTPLVDRSGQKILAFGGLALVAGAWLSMSWFRWADCLIDFGRELYIPWQMARGQVLYRDLYFYYGPLVKYFHAFLFKCFGASLSVIVIANLIILLVTVFLVYSLFKFFKGFWAGIIAIYLFLGIFAFGRYQEIGNYNYICPYSHELVYGLTLSFIGLLTIAHWLKQPKYRHLIIIGLLTGLIFLTKLETFIAFLGSVVLAVILDAFNKQTSMISFFKRSGVIFCFALIPPGVFLFYMSHQVSFHDAVKILVEPFVMARHLGFDHANMLFYKRISGFDDPRGNLVLAFTSAGGYISAALILGLFSYLIGCFKDKRIHILLILLSGIMVVLMAVHIRPENIQLALRGTPLILTAVILIDCYRFLKGTSQGKDLFALIFRTVLSVYALILISKILLTVTPFHYGFVLAAPGVLVIAVFMTNDLACFGKGKFYHPRIFRALAILFLLGMLIIYFRWSRGIYEHINHPVSQGKDQFLALDSDIAGGGYKSILINNILQWLAQNTHPEDTLVVMPDGVMINYLSRRRDPLPASEFEPSIVNLFGEDRIIDSLKRTAPPYIILLRRDMLEHGAQTFGVDYGQRIYQWILRNYDNILVWGELPSQVNNSRVPQAFLMRKII